MSDPTRIGGAARVPARMFGTVLLTGLSVGFALAGVEAHRATTAGDIIVCSLVAGFYWFAMTGIWWWSR